MWVAVTTSRQSTPDFMTLAFSIEQTLFDAHAAPARRPTAAMRSISKLVVDLGVDGALLAVAEVGDGLRLAEVDAAGQLADDQDVEALDQLALQRREVGQRVEALRRPQVGEELELLAQPQQPGLGADVVGHLVPLRPADRAEEHRVRGLRPRHRRRR